MIHVVSKTRSLGQVKNVYTLENNVLLQSSWNYFRISITTKSRSYLKLLQMGSETSALGQILKKAIHSRGTVFDPVFYVRMYIIRHEI